MVIQARVKGEIAVHLYLFVSLWLTMLGFFFPLPAMAAGGCPDIPLGGGESLNATVTMAADGRPLTDGAVVPTGTELRLDAVATAFGECGVTTPDPVACVVAYTEYRQIGSIQVKADITTNTSLNGNYFLGLVINTDGPASPDHIVDTRAENSSGPLYYTPPFPGVYKFNIEATIIPTACSIMPDKTALFSLTVYATDDPGRPLAYYALGDSVAAGHGLPNGGQNLSDPCQRSAQLAYPHRVWTQINTDLSSSYELLHFEHRACSGARSYGTPTAKEDLPEQIARVLLALDDAPSDQVTIISITIGANDFDFLRESFLGENLCEPDYQSWATERADEIQHRLIVALEEILERENVYVILTGYFNSYNQASGFFRLMRSAVPKPPFGESNKKCQEPPLSDRDLYGRTRFVIETLNAAIKGAAEAVNRPDRAVFVSLYETFQKKESAKVNCGRALPTKSQTWIQYPLKPLPGTFVLWNEMRKGNDCIHPNEKGAGAYADAVYDAALQLLLCLDCAP